MSSIHRYTQTNKEHLLFFPFSSSNLQSALSSIGAEEQIAAFFMVTDMIDMPE
jgi:hypothetical protein